MNLLLLKNKTTPRDSYEETFTENGHNPRFVPLLNHDPVSIEETTAYLSSPAFLDHTERFIITSQRAVIVFHECLDRLGATEPEKADKIRGKTGYTVGPATEKVLREKGFRDVRGGEHAGNGSILADLIQEELALGNTLDGAPGSATGSTPGNRIVFFTGVIRKDIIPVKLRRAGFHVEEVVIYKTEPQPGIIDNFLECCFNKIDWIVFFSPQGTEGIVEHLVSAERKPTLQHTKFASIGPTTQEYLVSRGINPDVVAAKPTAALLLQCLSL